MRHAGGRSNTVAWWAALCALGACSGALREPAAARHAQEDPAEPCPLGEVQSQGRDSALIVFRTDADARGTGQITCALGLASATLRPWPTASHDRWTVEIVLTERGAIAHRLGGERARDALDGGAALIATEDLDLTAYATARPDLHVTPLPWDRTYVHLSPSPVGPLGVAFAWDAVRVDARPAEALACDTVPSPVAPGSPRPRRARVVYEAGDRTARELAERVVAIMEDSAAVVGLAPAELESALRVGDELSYIVSLPRFPDRGCEAIAALARRAPWVTPQSIIPLVDTRAHAITPHTPRP